MSSEHSINGFMIACGMTGPLELEVEDRRQGIVERRVYHQPYVLVGRAPTSDLPLDDDQVSRRHVYLQVVAGRLYCLDLASRTGIHWEDGTFGSGSLDYSGGLKIGPFVIRLREGLPAPAEAEGERGSKSWESDSVEQRPRRLPRVTLVFRGDSSSQPPWRINRMLTLVGRSPLCRVLLSGAEVSRFHCSLIRTPIGMWMVDLQGRKGTNVNNRPTRCRLLGDGDELEVGPHLIQVHYGRYGEAGREESSAVAPSPVLPTAPSLGGGWPGESAPGVAASVSSSSPSSGMGLPAVPGFPSLVPAWSGASNVLEMKALLEGRPPEQVELAETLLLPVIHQFGQMQMQMFDQFQQALMMMFQMFSSMHREQMDVVREELGQIRHLTEELQAAQAELRQQAVASQSAAATKARPPLSSPAAPARDSKVTAPAWSSAPDQRRPGGGAEPRPESSSAQGGGEAQHPSAAAQGGATASTAGSGKREPSPSPVAAAPGAADSARNLHVVLAQRIASLQQERQTRWQKLVQMMTGGAGGQQRETGYPPDR